jgi:hypothetical protein
VKNLGISEGEKSRNLKEKSRNLKRREISESSEKRNLGISEVEKFSESQKKLKISKEKSRNL